MYDVTGNKMYQSGGSYHGKFGLSLASSSRGRDPRPWPPPLCVQIPHPASKYQMFAFCASVSSQKEREMRRGKGRLPTFLTTTHPHPHRFLADDTMCLLTGTPVFVGKDASRALAKTSTDRADVKPEWQDLGDKEKGTLNDWVTFFSKRYNVVGIVQGATNLE